MRKILIFIPAMVAALTASPTSIISSSTSYDENNDTIAVCDTSVIDTLIEERYIGVINLDTQDDTIVCDTLVEWDEVSVGILGDQEPESGYSVLGESSASLYKDKKFEYVTLEGCEYVFSVNSDGVSVTLEKGQAKNIEELTIPNGVNGLGSYFFVTAIGDFAFTGHSILGRREGEILPMDGVKKLIIPEGIEHVGQNCFDNAEDLEEVILPSSLKNLGY